MSGLAQAAGGGGTLEIDGVIYRIGKIKLSDFGTIGDHMLRLKRKALLESVWDLRDVLPEGAWQSEWEAAKKQAAGVLTVTMDEILAWVNSVSSDLRGAAFLAWICLNRENPGKFTYEELLAHMQKASDLEVEMVRAAVDPAAGTEELVKNSDAPGATGAVSQSPSQST